jgi:hypothetical protein
MAVSNGIYLELQRANLAGKKAYIMAYGTTVTYTHRAETAVELKARPMVETKIRDESIRAGTEKNVRGFEIYRQTGFPPTSGNITIGDQIEWNGNTYTIQSVIDIAGLQMIYQIEVEFCQVNVPGGKAE